MNIKVYKIGKTVEAASNSVETFSSAESAKEQLREAIANNEAFLSYEEDYIDRLKQECGDAIDDRTAENIQTHEKLAESYKAQLEYFNACYVYELTYTLLYGEKVK